MRTRLLLAGTALLTGALFAAAPAAQAEPYPAGDPALTSSTGVVSAGGAIQLSGSGYGPNDEVSIDATFGGSALGRLGRSVPGQIRRFPVGSAQANANGDWSTTITLEQTGVATIIATGSPSGVSQTTIVRVVGDPSLEDGGGGGDEGLPITGSRLTTAIVLGTVTVVVGAFLLWLPIALRRRGRHSDGSA